MSAMNHSGHDMSMMDTTTMGHAHMNHSLMDHTDHMNHMDHTDHMNHMDHTDHMDHSGHNMDHMDHSDHMDMPGMKMYFHEGYNEYVLFKDCETKSTEGMIAACFIIFVVAVLYEGLKYMREALLQRSLLAAQPRGEKYVVGQSSGTSQEQMINNGRSTISGRMLSQGHLVQTLLHIIQVFVSYCLMLVFMTYNIWLCLAVVLGAGVGYFLFGWKRAVVVDANEHCH